LVGDALEAGDALVAGAAFAIPCPEVVVTAAMATGLEVVSAARAVPHATTATATSARSSPRAAHRAREVDLCVRTFI
jgi:hypothetical protein